MPLTDAELLGENRMPIPRPSAVAPYDLLLLDRDGTLNVHRPGYIDAPQGLVLLPGAAQAVATANRAGCAVVLVTNQRGIATGRLTRAQLREVQRALVDELGRVGAWLDAIQLCPHAEGTCDCRKPRAGLVREALRRAPWASPARCVLIGDQPGDVRAATAAGVGAVRVGAGHSSLRGAVENLFRGDASRV